MNLYQAAALCSAISLASLRCAAVEVTTFFAPESASKVHSWWHWISGNITKEGVTRDLESMNARGISQVTILNVGGFVSAKLDVPNIKFGSPEWYEMFRFSLEEAKRLGMTVGVHNCDGWSTSGGPWVSPEQSMKEFSWSKTNVTGGSTVNLPLPVPPNIHDFYRDVVVLAYPNLRKPNSFENAAPRIEFGQKAIGQVLMDGNPLTQAEFVSHKPITISFDEPFEAEQVALLPHLVFAWDNVDEIPVDFTVSSSMDGKRFDDVATVTMKGSNRILRADIPRTKARHFRIQSAKGRNQFRLAELELLKKGEATSFPTRIHGLLQKTASVKTSSTAFYASTKVDGQPVLRRQDIKDITRHLNSRTGKLKWAAPEGEWTILRFGYTTTGFKNKPATPEGTGLEIDKMDALAAKAHFEAFTGKLIDVAGDMTGETFRFTLIDSWECRFQNWTRRFPEEFATRRGYDLKTWIPVLCGEVVEGAELSDGFLHDFRKTIADLIGENYYKAWADLCHQNKLEMHAEAIYGGGAYPPLDILKTNGYADLPMLEFWARPDKETFLPVYKPARVPAETFPSLSSLAYGKPVIGSEAYTNRSYYSESPGDLKQHGDAAFCAGVNQMILHSYVHQPVERKPGVTLGQFGAPFNRNNPWWKYATDWMTYQARAQYLLQRGEPVVDCIFFVGDHYPQTLPELMPKDLPEGFRAGACNLEMLATKARVVNGKISFGGAQQHAFLILPDCDRMELETLKTIHRLVEAGAIVYGPRPSGVLGVHGIEEFQSEFDDLVESLWGSKTEEEVEQSVGKGRVVSGRPLADLFRSEGLHPDFSAFGASVRELMYIHKKTAGDDIYFVFNQTDQTLQAELLFRIEGKSPEVWQAETGEAKLQPIYVQESGRIRMPMSFKPGESFFFVFRKDHGKPHVTEVMKNGRKLFPQDGKVQDPVPVATYSDDSMVFVSEDGGNYTFLLNTGETLEKELPKPTTIDVGEGGALLSFEPIYDETIETITMKRLGSITEHEDPAIKYFAGTLHYTLKFDVAGSMLAGATEFELDIGQVDAAAEVKLNGVSLGGVWAPGTRLSVENLVAGENTLEVGVATTCRNRLIGDLRTYGKVQTIFTTAPISKLLNETMPLKASGLMGPIQVSLR